MQEKKKAPGLYLQQAGNILALNVQLFCQKIDKKYRMAKWTTKFFFISAAIKIAVSVNWRAFLVSLC